MTVWSVALAPAAVAVGAAVGAWFARWWAQARTSRLSGSDLPGWGATARYVDRVVGGGGEGTRVVVAMVRVELDVVVRRFGLRARELVVATVRQRLERRFPGVFIGAGPAGELVLIVDGPPTPSPGRLGWAIHGVFASPVRLDLDVVDVQATVGVVSSTEVVGSGPDLLAAVVDATAAAGADGADGATRVGTARNLGPARLARRREVRFHRAIRSNELTAVYQPMVDPRRGQSIGVEALVRWEGAGGTSMPASGFVPLARCTGLEVDIDRWMLHRVRGDLASGVLALMPGSMVSVNLSARSLTAASIAGPVEALTDAASARGCGLCLELTETTPVDLDEGRRAVEALRDLGASLAIDDFGAGFASIAYLRALRPDWLKLDRGLTAGIGSSHGELQLVALIIELASNLGIRVCAEGVETALHAHTLTLLGCHALQGFYYSRPMPGSRLARHVTARPVDGPGLGVGSLSSGSSDLGA